MVYKMEPAKVGQMDGAFFGIEGPVDIVEVKCPVCGCDRLNLSGNGYECCDCGMVFEPEYRS